MELDNLKNLKKYCKNNNFYWCDVCEDILQTKESAVNHQNTKSHFNNIDKKIKQKDKEILKLINYRIRGT